jgi:NitT/TauT family transport system ATP-binding protein
MRPLPPLGINRIIGFIEALASPAYQGQAELATIAHSPSLSVRDVLAAAEVLHILEFAELKEGSIKLTAAGRIFAQSGTEERKRLFREHLLCFVPLAAHVRRVLDERADHSAPRVRFKSELEDHLSSSDAERTVQTIIRWGRYAEIFDYDDETRTFRANHSAA